MFAVEFLGWTIGVDVFQLAVPPDVPAFLDVNLVVGAAQHDHTFDARTLLQRVVHILLQRNDLAATESAIGSSLRSRFRREPIVEMAML